jgi:hypothetical protein
VAAPTEKDVETMPTQKVFKQRVRARMTKTGESYTAARRQLMRKTREPERLEAMEELAAVPDAPALPEEALLVADSAMVHATGKGHAEWFAILDAWGATAHNHTEIAKWLSETQGTPGWWTQNITVAYERARGMRARHQMSDGFSVSATRTVALDPDRALLAFTDPSVRNDWLPDAPLSQRPSRAAMTARFDWPDPPSRIVVTAFPKGDGRTIVSVAHEQLPDAEAAERLKAFWRASLSQLKSVIEGQRPQDH